jgi:thymidine phosphorylase
MHGLFFRVRCVSTYSIAALVNRSAISPWAVKLVTQSGVARQRASTEHRYRKTLDDGKTANQFIPVCVNTSGHNT